MRNAVFQQLLSAYNWFLADVILRGKIHIRELPFEIRRQNASAYVSQFRHSRSIGDQAGYDQALALLAQDLERMAEDDLFYRRFQDIYESRSEERQHAGIQKDFKANAYEKQPGDG